MASDVTVSIGVRDEGVKATVDTLRKEINAAERELVKLNKEWYNTGEGAEAAHRAEKHVQDLRQQLEKLTGTQRKTQREAKKSGDAFGRMGQKVNKALGALSNPLILAGAGTALALFTRKVINAASDMNESMSKTKVIFGAAGQQVIDWANESAAAIGQSSRGALESAANFASLGKAAGLTGGQLASFSTELVELASDMASFNNMTPEEAIVSLSSALRGEYESVRRFNVLLSAATLQQRAFNEGLIATPKTELDQQTKVLMAYKEILAQTTDQQGDFARTSDQVANLQRIVNAEWENSQQKIGEGLLPVFRQLLMMLRPVVGIFSSMPTPLRTTAVLMGVLGAAFVLFGQRVITARTALLDFMRTEATTRMAGFRNGLASAAGFMTGPWGAALAAGATALTLFWSASQEASEEQIALEGALDGVTDAMGRQSKAALAKVMQDNGMLEKAESLGISYSDLTQAIQGNEQAYNKVVGAIEANRRAWQQQAIAAQDNNLAFDQSIKVGDELKSQMDSLRNTFWNIIDANVQTKAATDATGAAYDAAADAADREKRAVEKLTAAFAELQGILDARAARRAMRADIRALGEAAKETTKEVKPGSEAFDALEAAVDALSSSSRKAAEGLEDPVEQTKVLKDALDDAREALKDVPMSEEDKKKLLYPLRDAYRESKKLVEEIAKIPSQIGIEVLWRQRGAAIPSLGTTPSGGRLPGDDTSPGTPGDTLAPWGTGAGAALAMHALLSDGRQSVLSALRTTNLGSSMSDHLHGRAVDVTGANLPSYAARVKAAGGYAAFHGQGSDRHLHAVPVTRRSGSGDAPAGGPVIGQVVVNNPATGVDVESAVLQAIRRAERIKRERG